MTARTRALFTRRRALTLSASAGAALMLPGVGHAKMPTGQPQAPTFYRFKLGSAECTVVTDGQLPLGDPKKSFLNISGEEIDRELRDNFLPPSNAVLEQNVLVVNFGDRVVLFDTGMGTDALFGDGTGKLMSTLKQAGIDPAAVDAVVMSHAHIDHCGGLVADDGSHNFPNARYFIGEPDFAYWTDDANIPADYPARERGARIGRLVLGGAGWRRRAAPPLILDAHRAVQAEPGPPSPHPAAAAHGRQLAGV